MLVWSSEFPVRSGSSPQQFLDTCIQWLVGSPHNPWASADFSVLPNLGTIEEYNKAGQQIRLGILEQTTFGLAATQYTWIEKDSRQWQAEVVLRNKHKESWVSVRISCELLRPGLYLPEPRKPFIVKLLLQNLGGGDDGFLQVTDKPHELDLTDIERAISIMRGTAGFRLPVVYVSAGWGNLLPLDPKFLATRLSGTAHVIVEPSRAFSRSLAEAVSNKNPYGGGVGIYWPGGMGSHTRFLPNQFVSADDLSKALAERVFEALAGFRSDPELTWAFLQEAVARQRLEQLKQDGSQELQDFVDAFDSELSAKDQRLAEAEREIGRLRSEVVRLEAKSELGEGLLGKGSEVDLYPGEINDAIVVALEHAKTHFGSGTRRYDIIADLLQSNTITGTADKLSSEIKRLLSGKPTLGSVEKRALEDLGFDLAEDGKHIQAIFRGDKRYSFAISKTGSDHRGGKNLAATIIRTLFK